MALVYQSAGTPSTAASGGGPTIVTTVALAAGDVLFMAMAYDNSAGSGNSDPITAGFTIAPAAGAISLLSSQTGLNDPGAASAGLCARANSYLVTSAIASGTNLVFSWTGTVLVRSIIVVKVNSNSGSTVSFRANSGTGTNIVSPATPTITTPSVNANELVLCWGGYEYGAAITADADTASGSWGTMVQANTGTTTAGMACCVQGKTVTATATQTFNPTVGTTSDWIMGAQIFYEGGRPKVWSGSAWVEKPIKVWSGSVWVAKPLKVWNGSAWVLA